MFPLQCTSESSSATCVTISPTKPVFNYNVKLVNPVCKSKYVIRKVRGIPKCTTINELRAKLCEKLKIDIAEFGYISPGHGLKGKLNPLTGDEDLEDMYGEYKESDCSCITRLYPVRHAQYRYACVLPV